MKYQKNIALLVLVSFITGQLTPSVPRGERLSRPLSRETLAPRSQAVSPAVSKKPAPKLKIPPAEQKRSLGRIFELSSRTRRPPSVKKEALPKKSEDFKTLASSFYTEEQTRELLNLRDPATAETLIPTYVPNESYVHLQTRELIQCMHELIANAQDTHLERYLREKFHLEPEQLKAQLKTIGRFGLGALQMFAELENENQAIVLETRKQGSMEKSTYIFYLHQGRLVFNFKTTPAIRNQMEIFPEGTKITVLKNLGQQEIEKREQSIRQVFHLNTRSAIQLQKEDGETKAVYDGDHYDYLNGGERPSISSDVRPVLVRLTSRGYTVSDEGMGMSAEEVKEKLLTPKNPEKGVLLETAEEQIAEVKVYSQQPTGNRTEGKIGVWLNGRQIFEIPASGARVCSEAHFIFPHNASTTEGWLNLELDSVAVTSIQAMVDKLTDPAREIPYREALIQNLVCLIEHLQPQRQHGAEGDLMNYLAQKVKAWVETLGSDWKVYPNEMEWEVVERPAKAIFISPKLMPQTASLFSGLTLLDSDTASKLGMRGVRIYLAPFKKEATVALLNGIDEQGKWILLDQDVWDRNKKNPKMLQKRLRLVEWPPIQDKKVEEPARIKKEKKPNFWKRHAVKIIAAGVTVVLIGVFYFGLYVSRRHVVIAEGETQTVRAPLTPTPTRTPERPELVLPPAPIFQRRQFELPAPSPQRTPEREPAPETLRPQPTPTPPPVTQPRPEEPRLPQLVPPPEIPRPTPNPSPRPPGPTAPTVEERRPNPPSPVRMPEVPPSPRSPQVDPSHFQRISVPLPARDNFFQSYQAIGVGWNSISDFVEVPTTRATERPELIVIEGDTHLLDRMAFIQDSFDGLDDLGRPQRLTWLHPKIERGTNARGTLKLRTSTPIPLQQNQVISLLTPWNGVMSLGTIRIKDLEGRPVPFVLMVNVPFCNVIQILHSSQATLEWEVLLNPEVDWCCITPDSLPSVEKEDFNRVFGPFFQVDLGKSLDELRLAPESERLSAIYTVMSRHFAYDLGSNYDYNRRSWSSTFEVTPKPDGKMHLVCNGTAIYFFIMAESLGLETIYHTAEIPENNRFYADRAGHTFCSVRVDGHWYPIETTALVPYIPATPARQIVVQNSSSSTERSVGERPGNTGIPDSTRNNRNREGSSQNPTIVEQDNTKLIFWIKLIQNILWPVIGLVLLRPLYLVYKKYCKDHDKKPTFLGFVLFLIWALPFATLVVVIGLPLLILSKFVKGVAFLFRNLGSYFSNAVRGHYRKIQSYFAIDVPPVLMKNGLLVINERFRQETGKPDRGIYQKGEPVYFLHFGEYVVDQKSCGSFNYFITERKGFLGKIWGFGVGKKLYRVDPQGNCRDITPEDAGELHFHSLDEFLWVHIVSSRSNYSLKINFNGNSSLTESMPSSPKSTNLPRDSILSMEEDGKILQWELILDKRRKWVPALFRNGSPFLFRDKGISFWKNLVRWVRSYWNLKGPNDRRWMRSFFRQLRSIRNWSPLHAMTAKSLYRQDISLDLLKEWDQGIIESDHYPPLMMMMKQILVSQIDSPRLWLDRWESMPTEILIKMFEICQKENFFVALRDESLMPTLTEEAQIYARILQGHPEYILRTENEFLGQPDLEETIRSSAENVLGECGLAEVVLAGNKKPLKELNSLKSLEEEIAKVDLESYRMTLEKVRIRKTVTNQDKKGRLFIREWIQNARDALLEAKLSVQEDPTLPPVDIRSYIRGEGDSREWILSVGDSVGMDLNRIVRYLLNPDATTKKVKESDGFLGQGFFTAFTDCSEVRVRTGDGKKTYEVRLQPIYDDNENLQEIRLLSFKEFSGSFKGSVIQRVQYIREKASTGSNGVRTMTLAQAMVEHAYCRELLLKFCGAVQHVPLLWNGVRINEKMEILAQQNGITLQQGMQRIERVTLNGLYVEPIGEVYLASPDVPPWLKQWVHDRRLNLNFPKGTLPIRSRTALHNPAQYQEPIRHLLFTWVVREYRRKNFSIPGLPDVETFLNRFDLYGPGKVSDDLKGLLSFKLEPKSPSLLEEQAGREAKCQEARRKKEQEARKLAAQQKELLDLRRANDSVFQSFVFAMRSLYCEILKEDPTSSKIQLVLDSKGLKTKLLTLQEFVATGEPILDWALEMIEILSNGNEEIKRRMDRHLQSDRFWRDLHRNLIQQLKMELGEQWKSRFQLWLERLDRIPNLKWELVLQKSDRFPDQFPPLPELLLGVNSARARLWEVLRSLEEPEVKEVLDWYQRQVEEPLPPDFFEKLRPPQPIETAI